MMTKSEAVLKQQQIAKRGCIVGTPDAIAALLGDILWADTRFRGIVAKYGPLPPGRKPKPGKEPGTEYRVLCLGRGPVKGVRTEQEQAARTVPNDLLTVYCVDAERRPKKGEPPDRSWRHINTRCLCTFEVYTGRKVPSTSPRRRGKLVGERVAVPVVVIG